MFEGISWKTYLAVIIISLIVYYLFVAVLERQWLKKVFSNRHLPDVSEEPEEEHFSSFDQLEKVVEDIRAILEEKGQGWRKQELLVQISRRLETYQGLKQQAFRIAVTNFTIQNSASVCDITFSEEELEKAWVNLPL